MQAYYVGLDVHSKKSAFVIEDEAAAVRAFHVAALTGGGHDDGGPDVRPQYHPYYASFVVDPDGHRIEAVCHAPENTIVVRMRGHRFWWQWSPWPKRVILGNPSFGR